jgi:hypothetical protein
VVVVVGGVVLAVLLVELLEPGGALLDRGIGGEVEDEGLDLRAEEVVRAGRAQGSQTRVLGGGEELDV